MAVRNLRQHAIVAGAMTSHERAPGEGEGCVSYRGGPDLQVEEMNESNLFDLSGTRGHTI